MKTCKQHTGRCNADLRGDWAVHHVTAGGPDTLSNALGMCQICHRNTPTYGTGKR
ncbi:MAG: hypothetical protein LAO51_16445 [Acidobacteriia bacterium]|nr:hypothetical protein [Terriglobia bacterium]